MSAPIALPAAQLDFMRGGVSVNVASCDRALRPSVMRAVGAEVRDAGPEVTVFLARPQARQLLQDIAASGRIAVVFSQPSSHRSLQLKASNAALRNATEADAPVLARYLAAMETELARIWVAPPLTRALLAHRIDELVAVSFTPEEAFEQTPGPRAGVALGGAR